MQCRTELQESDVALAPSLSMISGRMYAGMTKSTSSCCPCGIYVLPLIEAAIVLCHRPIENCPRKSSTSMLNSCGLDNLWHGLQMPLASRGPCRLSRGSAGRPRLNISGKGYRSWCVKVHVSWMQGLGSQKALVVHSGGLDELTPLADADVVEVTPEGTRSFTCVICLSCTPRQSTTCSRFA